MIALCLTAEPPLTDYERRCRQQIAELRADNGLCGSCGERPHEGGCRFALGYADRKQIGRCTYPGCPEACCETSVQCEEHRAASLARWHRHAEKTGGHFAPTVRASRYDSTSPKR